MRAGIKRNQEKQQDRMLNTASKRFKHAEVGDSVLIPISQPDKIQSLGPRNILGCITSRDDSSYSIGTIQGTQAVNYSRFQFELCPTKLMSLESIPPVTISRQQQCRVLLSASLATQLADASIAKLRDVPAGNLVEAVTQSVIGDIYVLTNKWSH